MNSPDEKPIVYSVGYGNTVSDKTNAEITLEPLTNEVLRDIGRNEGASRSWRKAAVKFLMNRNHKYQHHQDFSELRSEILDEMQAERDVEAIVETAIEEPFSSLSELEGPKDG